MIMNDDGPKLSGPKQFGPKWEGLNIDRLLDLVCLEVFLYRIR